MKNLKTLAIALVTSITLFNCSGGGSNDPEPVETTDSEGKPAFVYGEENGPQMAFQKIEHDFGEINKGDKVRYPFLFTNTGSDTLMIYGSGSTCGCTTSKITKNTPILPGTTDTVEVQFDSKMKAPGKHYKEIKISSNVYENKEKPVTLKIYATVKKPNPEITDSTSVTN